MSDSELYATFAGVLSDPCTFDSTRLGQWRAALANRAAAGPKAVVVGDSWGEGAGASTIMNRWLDRLTTRLRGTFNGSVVGGAQYVPGFYASSLSGTNPWVVTGGGTSSAWMGLGLRVRVVSSGGTATITRVCTGVDIYVSRGGNSGSISYTIDGGTAVAVTLGPSTPELHSVVVPIRNLSAASHTLVITATGGALLLEGGFFYNGDETLGVKVWDGSRIRYTTGDYLADQDWADALTTIQPALVVLALGINDYQVTPGKVSAATYQANLTALLALIRSKITLPPSIILWVPTEAKAGDGFLSPYTDFVTAARAAAQDDGKVTVFEADKLIPDISTALLDTYGYGSGDFYHVNDKGHQALADRMYEVLTGLA